MEQQSVGDFLIASRAAVRQAGELLVGYSFSIVGATGPFSIVKTGTGAELLDDPSVREAYLGVA